ncbi:lectin [Arsukibacterium sp. MJ3]|uniref:hypothetical protein n=1 Tax=Arsukibacterium sp. MJ3 TaxID=1632859 RepID=UPI000626FC4C|nr:hypothetical protein [Arsukibacterium sp. MJ3]KKO47569.1 lectin [Arsukibacterium sp. MJ3]
MRNNNVPSARSVPARRVWLGALCLLVAYLVFQPPAYAQDATGAKSQDTVGVKPVLTQMLGNLKLDSVDELQKMVGALTKTSCGGGLTGCYSTRSGPLHLYFYTTKDVQQTFIIVVDQDMAMPKLFGDKVHSVLGSTKARSLMISISTTDFDLSTDRMPPDLKKVVDESYFGVSELSFSSGVQMAARVNVGGVLKTTMVGLGVHADQLTLRGAVVMPIPLDIASGAGAAAGIAGAVADGATMTKSVADAMVPEAFVEFQFAPGSRLPLLLPPITLTDATFYINNMLVAGYKGNAGFHGVLDKKFLMEFYAPLTPAGEMDLADFGYRIATPASFTLEDAAYVIAAMATPDPRLARYGGGLIGGINAYKAPLLAAAKPLSMFRLENPHPAPEYRFGDKTKPWPANNKHFNMVSFGPLADNGPYYANSSDTVFLGTKVSQTEYIASIKGLQSSTTNGVELKLGPLGKVKVNMTQSVKVTPTTQEFGMAGNFAGQKVEVVLGTTHADIFVNASCVNPFEIKGSVELQPDLNIAKVFEGHGGVNVDPSKIQGCIGKELEAAYNKIAKEYSHLSGYTASAANAELNKISKLAEEEAQRVAKVAEQDYNRVKNAARDVASKTSNAANKAFNDAGNAFKKLGKKKKHKKGPNPIFAASVFDWDYYYDNAPDVVRANMDLATHWKDSGFNEGRQGSLEFSASFYLSHHSDLMAYCGQGNWQCATQHWLDNGIREGRQGSANFSIASYLNRYPDLQNAFGKTNYEDALDHWFNSGEDEGRNPQP